MTIDDQTRLVVLREILEETELVVGEDGALYAFLDRDGRQVT